MEWRAVFVAFPLLAALPAAHASQSPTTEAYIPEPLPPHFRVVATELDGPVFADARGHTLYTWPFKIMRVGNTGDPKGQSNCTSTKTTANTGYMSPYPGGLGLPDLEERPSCTQAWPPALAASGAQPVGKWTLITRQDGGRQWAYDGFALYTCALDRQSGDVLGGRRYDHRDGDDPAERHPIGPSADVPPGFRVATTNLGRALQTERGFSVYAFEGDEAGHSHCDADCAQQWIPLAAPATVRPHGDWSVIERSPGSRQWVFRGQPLYRHSLDDGPGSQAGSDERGWHNVYVQRSPAPPADFTTQATTIGLVLADVNGMTIYTYSCGDDAPDQLGCDHPSETQAYRLAMCGGGDAERCLRTFPYVLAAPGARSGSRAWSVIDIDPLTGRRAKAGQPGTLHVWAFRDRPVYTYAGDHEPGDVYADGHGEFRAEREGYTAWWLRDDYFGRDQ
jgi:predicted lipoprotein with Yx(FWY)xxD motif